MNLSLERIHKRRQASSTKLASNTYGSVPWQDDPEEPHWFEANVRYYQTDIIRCYYYVTAKGTLAPHTVFINTEGWNNTFTFRRINQFLRDNNIKAGIHSYKGEVFLLTHEDYANAEFDYIQGLHAYPVRARRVYNLFDNSDNTGVIIL